MKRHILVLAVLLGITSCARAVPLVVPNAGGTAAMPILGDYVTQSQMAIINGLPLGSTVQIDATLETPVVFAETAPPDGILGGTKAAGGGSLFTFNMQGTGVFASYSRTLSFPAFGPGGVASFPSPAFSVTGASYEVHSAPRTLNAPVQSYPINLFRAFSQITSDVDFDLLRVVAGTDFGLPSPGHTILTQNPNGWTVDSCIDMTYRIDFVGRAAGPFGGMSGSSTGVARLQAGDGFGECVIPEPSTVCLVAMGVATLSLVRRRKAKA
jgi:hypothetical protein